MLIYKVRFNVLKALPSLINQTLFFSLGIYSRVVENGARCELGGILVALRGSQKLKILFYKDLMLLIWMAHPLMLTLEEISKTEAKINTITLATLSSQSLNKLVSDTLNNTYEDELKVKIF
ncbi:MAG: hypothetical protein AAF915_20015 [Cyanobacteria bacterium P01_D01_bin.50]